MLTLQNIHHAFGQQPILNGVSFEAKPGEVIALLGSSGSGKSTLLRCINLLTVPKCGQMVVGEQAVMFNEKKKAPLTAKQLVALRTKVGMVFQQYNLWAHKTILENLIEAPVHVLKKSKAIAIKEAQLFLEKVGLSDKQKCYPAALSGGQQQRAAIARALMMKPELMLFDEPTSALDPEMVGEVLRVMLKLAKEGMTMVIATHELNFAQKVATRTLFLEGGTIIEQGKTNEMFAHPETMRFKQFLQSLNHEQSLIEE